MQGQQIINAVYLHKKTYRPRRSQKNIGTNGPKNKVAFHINDAEETTSNRQNIPMTQQNSPNTCTSMFALKTVYFDTHIQPIKS
jgi:hypothetical protein